MAAETELNVRVRGRDELSPTLSQLESRVIRFIGAVSAGLAAIKITTAPLVATAQFERELANVQKTTNFTRSEIAQLSDELQRLGTRIDVSTLDLTRIAAAAGQQGLGRFGVEGVVQFTESVSRMSSVLDITAEDAAVSIGKIANVFKIPLQDIESAVSTFNQVSNNSTASGEELLDVVRRIGDAAGTLNLQQSVALAATGLDFGVNPEVVGTSFTKIFSSLTERAEDFGKLLKTDTQTFIKLLKDDGIAAFQEVLAVFRTLDPSDQQEAIVKLFGGGRIGALVNKLVQDTQDAVLTRNLQQAVTGRDNNSAVKEQATVLNTLVAQAKTTLNSLFALGTDATEQALLPLTQYVVQLNQALQSDGLKSFLNALVGSILDLVDGVVTAVKFVASLNVNWENFIRVAQVFLGLKLAQYFGGILSRNVSSFASTLGLVAANTDAAAVSTKALGAAQGTAAAQQAASDAAFKGSIRSRILGYEELSAKLAAYRAAKQAEAVAERNSAAAAKAAQAAQGVATVAGGRNTAATSQLQAAAGAAQAQRAALAAAERNAAAQQAAIQQTLNAKLAAAAQKDAATRLQIETAYQQRLAAIKATGSTAGLTALKREQANQIAQADAFYARSIASTQAYYARQAVVAAAGSATLVNVERAALASRLSALDGAIAAQAVKGANATVATGAAVAANAALAASTARLSATTIAANAASAALANVGLAFRTLGTIAATVGRLIAGSLFWITILYSIGDALGLFDNFGKKVQEITDYLGFTSEATRKAVIEDEKRTKAIKDQAQALDDLIDKYKEFVDASTGQASRPEIGRLVQIASTSEDVSTRQQALATLVEFNKALEAERERALQTISISNPSAIAKAREDIATYQKEIAKLQKQQATPQVDFAANGQSFETPGPDNTRQIDEFQKKISEANKNIAIFEKNIVATRDKLNGINSSIRVVGAEFAGIFSAKTLEFAKANVDLLAEQETKLKALKTASEDAEKAALAGGESAKIAAQAATAEYETLRGVQAATKKALIDYANEQIKMKGVPPETVKSWQGFLVLLEGTANNVKSIVDAAAAQVAIGAPTNAANANPNQKSPTSGNVTLPPRGSGGESRARKEERARLSLERARIQAENALKEELSKQALDKETIAYERGLRQLREYYKNRRDIQQQANQFDIDDAQAELREVEISIARANTKAEKDGFRATAVRLQGQINVLQARKNAIDVDVAEEERRAENQFADRIKEETNKLVAEGIISADATTAFEGNLDQLYASYRDFIQQLRTEGRDALAASLIQGLNVEALRQTLEPIQRDLDASQQNFQRYASQLQLAQQEGVLTNNQFLASYDTAVRAQVVALQQFIDQQQTILDQNKDLAGTRGYRDIAASIQDARIQLAQFNAEQNQVAKNFNAQTQSTLSNVLGNLRLTSEGIKDALIDLLEGVVGNIQQTLGESISQSITQSLGQVGAGGLGGFIQNLTQGPESLAASALAERGATFANPLFVSDVNAPAAAGTDALGDFIKKNGIGDDTKKAAGGLLSGPGTDGFFTKLSTTVSGVFGSLSSSLGGLFTGLISTLGTLFSSLVAALAGSSSSGGLLQAAGAFFGAAHTGGIAGKPKMRRWAPISAFNNAAYYHNGGVAGLKPNEVPTILEEGETIRTQQQEKALQSQLNAASSAGASAGAGSGKGVRVVLVDDRTKVPEAMNSPEGDQVFVQQARRNIATLKQLMR